MRLSNLISVLHDAVTTGPPDPEIRGFSIDSRTAGPGDLFIALRGGEEKDRHLFVPDALSRGVSAVLVEDDLPTGAVTCIRVPDAKRALALLADHFYGQPWRTLPVIGVTGTCGKTTTTFLIRSILASAGIAAGRIGTHHNVVGGKILASNNTTPFAHDVFRLLRMMADAGDRAAVMEVTSHALALDRVYGIGFRLGLFTNLSRDHLNFHGTEEAYFEAKALLFERLSLEFGAKAIVNSDDPASSRVRARTSVPVITFGSVGDADVRPVECVSDWQGTRMRVATPGGDVQVRSNLRGPFNVSNLLAAVAAGWALGIAPDHIQEGLVNVQVPGRFESVDAGQSFAVIVDFAHKPDALEKVLTAARSLTRDRLISVFGCGGDRDRGKRPIMGKLSADMADMTILTSDNPRSERPESIVDEIAAGIPAKNSRGKSPHVKVILDRREAIRTAIVAARSGDVVVIAGKGDEDYQEIAGVRHSFDDRVVATEALRSLSLPDEI